VVKTYVDGERLLLVADASGYGCLKLVGQKSTSPTTLLTIQQFTHATINYSDDETTTTTLATHLFHYNFLADRMQPGLTHRPCPAANVCWLAINGLIWKRA
jgi:hypothetical protein